MVRVALRQLLRNLLRTKGGFHHKDTETQRSGSSTKITLDMKLPDLCVSVSLWSRRATRLRTITPEVLNVDGVFPRDLLFCHAESGSHPLPLRRTRSVVAADDCRDQFCVHSCAFYQLIQSDPHLFQVPCDRFHISRILTSALAHRQFVLFP